MDIALVVIAGFGLFLMVVSSMLVMFVLFNYSQVQGGLKAIVEQTFVQTQLGAARLQVMEQQLRYIGDVIKREEMMQMMMGAGPGSNPKVQYQNEDGSLRASSLGELLDAMSRDLRYNPTAPDVPVDPPESKDGEDFLERLFDPYKIDEDEEEKDGSGSE